MSTGPRGPVTIKELTAGLIWPTLLRAAPMALDPSRLVIGFLCVAIIMGLGSLYDAVIPTGGVAVFHEMIKGVTAAASAVAAAVVTLEPRLVGLGAERLGHVWSIAMEHPVSAVILSAVALVVWSVAGGAISRMAISDVSLDRDMGWTKGLGFALARWKDLVVGALGPALLLAVIALLMAVGGFLLLRWPVLNIVGGAIYGLCIAGGLVFVLTAVGLALAHPLIIAAVATESTDGFDAMQRAYAYVLGRTGRLLLYAAILAVYGALAYAAASFVVTSALNFTAGTAFAWTGAPAPPTPYAGGYDALLTQMPDRGEALTGTAAVTAGLISVWERVALAMLGGFVISFYFCASSLLYLLVRRVNDDQDIHDVWKPGMVASTLAPVGPAAPAATGSGSSAGGAAARPEAPSDGG